MGSGSVDERPESAVVAGARSDGDVNSLGTVAGGAAIGAGKLRGILSGMADAAGGTGSGLTDGGDAGGTDCALAGKGDHNTSAVPNIIGPNLTTCPPALGSSAP
jgi:hypothetical protein